VARLTDGSWVARRQISIRSRRLRQAQARALPTLDRRRVGLTRLAEEVIESVDLSFRKLRRITGQDARHVAELSADVHAVTVDRVLTDALVVHRAAHFKDGDSPAHFAEHLDVTQQNNRIGNRRNVLLGDRRASKQRRRR